jgi:flagellar basal body P-ring formation protein FlgA
MKKYLRPIASLIILFCCAGAVLAQNAGNDLSGPVSAEQIKAAGEDYLQAQAPAGAELAVTCITSCYPLAVPAGKVTFKVAPYGATASPALVRLGVSVLVNGKLIRTCLVNYRLQRLEAIMVTARDLPRLAVLSEADIKLEKRDVLALKGEPFKAAGELVGRRITNHLSAGSALTDNCAEPAPLVKKNQSVIINALAGGVQITTSGVALEEGALGQAVSVRSDFSKEPFSAVVVGAAAVELRL